MQSLTHLRRSALGAGAVLITSLSLAACGSAHHSSAGVPAASSATGGVKLAACMRSHGVPDYPDVTAQQLGDAPTPKNGHDEIAGHTLAESETVVEKASTSCQSDSNAAQFGPRLSSTQMTQLRAEGLKYAACMRSHSIDYPDPVIFRGPGGYGWGYGMPKGAPPLNYRTPQYAAANRICSPILKTPARS